MIKPNYIVLKKSIIFYLIAVELVVYECPLPTAEYIFLCLYYSSPPLLWPDIVAQHPWEAKKNTIRVPLIAYKIIFAVST